MPGKPKTPGAVIGAGILLISYGAILFLLCGVLVGALAVLLNDPQAEAQVAQEVPGFMAFKIGEPVANMVVGLMLVLLGLGVFRLAPAARRGVYLVSACQILIVITGVVYRVIYIFPILQEGLAQHKPEIAQVFANFKWLIVALLILIPVVFCLPAILLLSLKSSRAAFAGEVVADPRDREEPPPRYDGYDDGYNNP